MFAGKAILHPVWVSFFGAEWGGGGHQTEQAFALPPWRGGAKRVAPKVKARLPGICVCAT